MMRSRTAYIFTILVCLFQGFELRAQQPLTGAEQMAEWLPLIKGKTVGLVVNQTSVIGAVHLADTLKSLKQKVGVIFAPEHGFRGNHSAGTHVSNETDPQTGIKVSSLYGSHRKPTKEDLKGIDIVVFDIQDVGVRFYTYIGTMHYVMEACAENKIPFIVLDRPNPNGHYVDGPILDTAFRSFVGMHPVPLVHGMTVGEFARMINGEGWLKTDKSCKLTVIPLKYYTHRVHYNLPVKPSPNLQAQSSIYLYASLGLFEGTVVSIGQGTKTPYQCFGWPGLKWGTHTYKPVSIPGVAEKPKFLGVEFQGFDLTDYGNTKMLAEPKVELNWLTLSYGLSADKSKFFTDFFDKLAGTDKLRKQVIAGLSPEAIRQSWQPGLDSFRAVRQKYLLYE